MTDSDVLGVENAGTTLHQMDQAQLPFSDSSGRLEFGKGVPTLLPNLRFEELLN
jgi:hypothetical protein